MEIGVKNEAELRETFMELSLEDQQDLLVRARQFQAGQKKLEDRKGVDCGWNDSGDAYIGNKNNTCLTCDSQDLMA